MKIKGLTVLLCIIAGCCFCSCSEDDDGGYSKLANEEHEIVLKIYSNTAGVPISVQSGLTIKDYWETKYITKDYFTQIVARCDDATVLLTGEIYVDGILKAESKKNSYLNIGYRIKGNGY